MAVTAADVSRSILRNKRFVVSTITFDSSYPTGGEAFTASDLGLGTVDFITFAGNGANDVVWDRANNKLKVFVASTGVEVANATNLSTLAVDVFAVGS